MATSIKLPHAEELLREYERLEVFCSAAIDGPGRTTTLGWDLEYASPTALLSFVDHILFRRLNDFEPESDAPVIIDCGANIGYTALYYKRRFPGAQITAFEPDPQFLPLLQANLRRNGATDVRVVPAAAWIRDGDAPWIMERKDGSRLADSPAPGTTVTVPTVDLRSCLQHPVDLLKLDIEGAEFTVVPHLAPALDMVRNIIVECHLTDRATYAGLARLIATLTAAGFAISVNSYGPWRDLTRRHIAEPLHADQYLAVYGWRGDRPPASTEPTFLPYVGITHFRDLYHAAHVVGLTRHHHDVGRAVQMLLGGEKPAGVHRITTPIRRERGHCWYYRLPGDLPAGDSMGAPPALTLVLENDRALGPGHAPHDEVRDKGGGLFSHWHGQLYFSTSDNSDPTINGRVYTIICL